MEPALLSSHILASLSFFLLLGVFTTIVSIKLNIPRQLLLIFLGLLLSIINYYVNNALTLPNLLIESIALFALALVVFSGTSMLKLKEIDEVSSNSLLLVFSWLLLLFVATPVFMLSLNIPFTEHNFLYSLAFMLSLLATDATIVFSSFQNLNTKIVRVIELESILNTPLATLIPLTLVYYSSKFIGEGLVLSVLETLRQILNSFIIGIGTGVLFGFIIVKIVKNIAEHYPEFGILNSALLLASTLYIYTFSEILGGTGIVAVAIFGLIYGKLYIKGKNLLRKFESVFSEFLQILVYILIGFIVNLKSLSKTIVLLSLIIFVLSLALRAISVFFALNRKNFTLREIFFTILSAPKGIATAVVALTFSLSQNLLLREFSTILILITLYSILLSIFTNMVFKNYLAEVELAEKGKLVEVKKENKKDVKA